MAWSDKTEKESLQIFTTGVVQRAAQAGMIRDPSEIDRWVKSSVEAYKTHVANGSGIEKTIMKMLTVDNAEALNQLINEIRTQHFEPMDRQKIVNASEFMRKEVLKNGI